MTACLPIADADRLLSPLHIVLILSQFAQQRLKKGAVIGGWVSSFYLLLPAGLTPFLGIYIDVFGQRIGFRKYIIHTAVKQCG